MIDPLEPKTRTCVFNDTAVSPYTQAGVFTADEDITLRAVYMNQKDWSGMAPQGDAVLSTDPDFTGPQIGTAFPDLWLDSRLNTSWENLVFPISKGQKLYWGVSAATSLNAITLIYT